MVLGIAVVCGLPAFAVSADKPAEASAADNSQPARVQVAENWHIEVVPGPSVGTSSIPRYREVYHSIPFSRAEYESDPSFRHEATIEVLFGKMRRKVVMQSARPLHAITINNMVSFGPIADYPKTRSKGSWRP